MFDEAHTFTGAQGAETACLIRRLRAYCGRAAQATVCVATSATIVDKENPNAAREFASRFFGVQADAVTTVGEAYERETWGATRSVPPAPQQDPAALLAEIAWQLAELLATPTALDQLPQQLLERVQRPVSEEEVLARLTLGAAARSDNRPLLRPVVHAFVRGISGAVVTFPSDATDPKLWLAAEDELHDTGEGDRHAYCLISTSVEGSRQGKIVLVQLRSETDPESGARYTVKRYESEKSFNDDDTWRHVKIMLKPLNSAFSPIVLTEEDEGSIHVVAEFLQALQ